MLQILCKIPILWLAIAGLTLGVCVLAYGLFVRRKDTAITGAVVVGAVLVAALLFRQRVMEGKVPIFGFGLTLCLAFFAATWLAHRLARREGLDPERVMDLGLWIFIGGIIGARLLFMVRNPSQFNGPLDFFKFWEGGIVFYGGVAAAVLVFLYYTRHYGLPALRVLDVLAPAIALGIGVGRFGCLLNGCCWGKPSDLPWAVSFPFGSIPYMDQLYEYPDRVSLGFHISNQEGADPTILEVDAGSWAEAAGLERGDRVRRVGDRDVVRPGAPGGQERRDAPAVLALMREAKPGSELSLEVQRDANKWPLTLDGTFRPAATRSLPVHPTQVYLALAGWLLLALTLGFYWRRRRHGEVMVLLMVGYALSRFAIEFFRDDEPPWADGLTISQNVSLLILAGGLLLWGWLRRRPAIETVVPVKL